MTVNRTENWRRQRHGKATDWRVLECEYDGDDAVRDGKLERFVTREQWLTDSKATTDGMATNNDIVAECMGSIWTHG